MRIKGEDINLFDVGTWDLEVRSQYPDSAAQVTDSRRNVESDQSPLAADMWQGAADTFEWGVVSRWTGQLLSLNQLRPC